MVVEVADCRAGTLVRVSVGDGVPSIVHSPYFWYYNTKQGCEVRVRVTWSQGNGPGVRVGVRVD